MSNGMFGYLPQVGSCLFSSSLCVNGPLRVRADAEDGGPRLRDDACAGGVSEPLRKTEKEGMASSLAECREKLDLFLSRYKRSAPSVR